MKKNNLHSSENLIHSFPKGVYGITPSWENLDKLLTAICTAASHGMTALQVRNKNLERSILYQEAKEVVQLCRELNIISIINDDWKLACDVDANGVHLGKNDDPLDQVRKNIDRKMLIGVSCYNSIDLAYKALLMNVDYIAFGSVFTSPTKPNANRAPLSLFKVSQQLRKKLNSRSKIIAIGGININNVDEIVQSGVDSVAILSGVFHSNNIGITVQKIASMFL